MKAQGGRRLTCLLLVAVGFWSLLIAALPSAGVAQSTPPVAREDTVPRMNLRQPPVHAAPILVNVNMVLVPVTVLDPFERIVTGLEASNFEIYDEKVVQHIRTFSYEDAPIAVGLIFDSSGSMGGKIAKAKEAMLQFFKTANPQDEFMCISFSDRPYLVSPFTSKYEHIQDRLLFVKSGGQTALLDALYLALTEMKKATANRKALLVFSDGGDNNSRYTARNVKEAVKESAVQIYAVGIFESVANRSTPEEKAGPSLLSELTDLSGGRLFSIESADELPDIAEKISIELRNQYVLGYTPSNLVRDGRWRRIRVKLNPPRGMLPLQVHARTGYYAPTQ